MSVAGKFKIRVATRSYPAWCTIYVDDKEVATVGHYELSDLKYAVEKAMKEARCALPDQYKDEV